MEKNKKQAIEILKDAENYVLITKETTVLVGSESYLLTFLSSLVKNLARNIPKERIEYAVKLGLMTDEELEEETKKNLKEMINKLFKGDKND